MLEGKRQRDTEEKAIYKTLWNKVTQLKIMIHAWRVIWGRIPTYTKLIRRNVLVDQANHLCTFYGSETEYVSHVLFTYSFVYKFWMDCIKWMRVNSALPFNPTSIMLLNEK